MKIAIVTSEVTFVKENYNQFLVSFFTESSHENITLIVLKNNHLQLILKGLLLFCIGARHIGIQLIRNSLSALSRDHEKVATSFGIKTLYFNSANAPDFFNFIVVNKIDLIINARTRDIYKKKILKTPRLGCLNIHHGILPQYRGTLCDLYALYEGRPAGFSIHKMETKIDAGDILLTKTVTDSHSSNHLNFPLHIFTSSKIEGIELSHLVKKITKLGELPKKQENISDDSSYTKTPNFSLIRQMLQKGMIL